MRLRRALCLAPALATLLAADIGAAQTITVGTQGPRGTGRELRDVLAGPHRVIIGTDSILSLPRDSVVTESIVIIGAPRVTVASTVHGSVIVVGGDLWLHPGVAIVNDAVAYGGGVYTTMLGTVGGRIISYRDFTFDVTEVAGGYDLAYRSLALDEFQRIELPGLYGLRVPSYDRVNGLSLPVGPRFWLDSTRYSVDPIVTYRTDLGVIDPEIRATAYLSRTSAVDLVAGRTTLTNEGWIRGAFINSITALFVGSDVRNYWRADRADVRYRRDFERDNGVITPFVGALYERGWSVAPAPGAQSGPWSVLGRDDEEEGMLRPNPEVRSGRITSALVGTAADLQLQDVVARLQSLVEVALDAPDDRKFVQATLDGRVQFPAVRNHRFQTDIHALLTFGDVAPPQRFSYLGGSGTLPTVLLLSIGGDHLLFVESMYTIPVERISIKFLGSPAVSVRHMIGSAGVDRLPGFINNVGLRVTLSLLKADFVLDPETRDTDFSIGLSFAR